MANRFKITGAHNWNTTNAWSATSTGGAAGASFPIAGDNVTLDAVSGNLTVNVASACANFDATGYLGTLAFGGADLTVSGTLTWPASGATSAFSNTIVAACDGLPAARAWALNGIAASASVTVSGTAAANGPQLTGTATIQALTLTQGTLSIASGAAITITEAFTSSNTNARTLSIAGASITLTGTVTVWDCSTATNLTVSAAGSTITIDCSTGDGKTFKGGGKTYGNLVVSGAGGDAVSVEGANTFSNLTVNGTVLVSPENGSVVSGTFTLTAGTLFATGAFTCGAFSSSGTGTREFDFEDTVVTLTGTGDVWDCSTATNLSFSTTGSGSEIVISDTSASPKNFKGGGKTYSCLFTITGSAGAVTFTGNNTFSQAFTSGATPLVFTGTTQTFGGTVTLTGCPSITGGTLSKASGTVTAPAGCLITDCRGTGGATFDGSAAYYGGGDCTGWTGLKQFPRNKPSAIGSVQTVNGVVGYECLR